MNMLASANPFFASDYGSDMIIIVIKQQANVERGAMGISGSILEGIGFIVIVIGAIVYFFRDRKRVTRRI